jgi:hypothetical protein
MSKQRRLSQGRYKTDYDNRDKGGAQRKNFIDWNKAGKISFFNPVKDNSYKLNIIPFEIKSKWNPLVKAGRAQTGELDYALDVWVHRYVGPTQADVLCLKKTYGKSCPICDQQHEYYDAGKKEEAKKLKATRRVLMNVQVVSKDGPGDIQVFDVSHFLFMKELLEEAHECRNEGEEIVPFADLENGTLIKFRAVQGELSEKVVEFKSFQFLERPEKLKDELIDKAVSFDDFLIIPTADECEKLMYGQEEDAEEGGEEERPTRSSGTAEKSNTKPSADEEPEEDTPPPPRRRAAAPDPEDEPPARGRKSEPAAEDDPPPRARPTAAATEEAPDACPHGHVWGKDHDKKKECGKCKVWDNCLDEANK